jgi:beta-lactam-binding protein with PASTA domain
MTQMPPPGTKVRRGWSIRVAQSLGRQRVAIPDVTGGSERVAELNIRRRGISLGSIAHVNLRDAPLDQVISQSPPPNASGVSAPKISLLVSDGPEPPTYLMPNLTGQPLGSAMPASRSAESACFRRRLKASRKPCPLRRPRFPSPVQQA